MPFSTKRSAWRDLLRELLCQYEETLKQKNLRSSKVTIDFGHLSRKQSSVERNSFEKASFRSRRYRGTGRKEKGVCPRAAGRANHP